MAVGIPTVAIMGRPNVGKSTLFNRVVGKRLAIVHEREGITRDRVVMEAEWAGNQFYLVDTGGYIPKGGDVIDKEVKKQAELALDEADVVVLLVDSVVGITAVDETIAKLAKRSKKPLILAANKADNDQLERDSNIFLQLGVGKVYPISALNGRAVGDLLDAVVAEFGEIGVLELDENVIRFSIVGMPNAGKSSLTNAILGRDQQIVTDIPGTTRDSINSRFKYYGHEFEMIDTAGLRKKARVHDSVEYYSTIRTQQAIRASDVVVTIIDAEKGFASQDARVIDEIISQGKGLIVAVNKWDLIEKDNKTLKNYAQNLVDEMFLLRHYPIVFISAKERQRIFRIVEKVQEIHSTRQQRIGTRQLNLFLEDAYSRRQPPAVKGNEIKLNFCSQVRTAPPLIIVFTNYPKLIPASYKRFLENRFRETFGFQGVPITIQFRHK